MDTSIFKKSSMDCPLHDLPEVEQVYGLVCPGEAHVVKLLCFQMFAIPLFHGDCVKLVFAVPLVVFVEVQTVFFEALTVLLEAEGLGYAFIPAAASVSVGPGIGLLLLGVWLCLAGMASICLPSLRFGSGAWSTTTLCLVLRSTLRSSWWGTVRRWVGVPVA